MLHELRIENLLLMDRAELRLAAGLNVLTGETGAGKTLLAHALDLLLGGRARSGIVREGAAEAYVEGVFALPDGLSSERDERIPDGASELVLARRVWPDGRTRAYVCGRSRTVADLSELGSRVMTFYGQHEHRKLMLSSAQLAVLDGHCGAPQLELRDQLGQAYETVRSLRQTVDELRALSSSRERELDLLGFELAEIESVSPSEEEEQALGLERDRLRHLESLQAATHEGVQALAAEDGGGVAAVLAAAAQGLELAARVDPALQPLAARLQGIGYEAQDLAGELRSYHESLDLPPGRLEEVEERLAVLSRLTRKHGGSIEAVLSHAEQCRERWAELEGAEVALEQAQDDLRRGEEELERLATELSRRREAAAPKLSAAVSERLAELAMPDAEFTVEVAPRPDGCGPAGADAVELLIAPNPGLPAGPLREIASGGELSRVMLALLSVAHGGEERSDQSLLVFDEVDAGIGGHTARAVGKHLRALAANRQILCITHLPQLAALAARHFTISKELGTVPAKTRVSVLDGDGVVGELVRMLGATENDRAASQHARELLRAA